MKYNLSKKIVYVRKSKMETRGMSLIKVLKELTLVNHKGHIRTNHKLSYVNVLFTFVTRVTHCLKRIEKNGAG